MLLAQKLTKMSQKIVENKNYLHQKLTIVAILV